MRYLGQLFPELRQRIYFSGFWWHIDASNCLLFIKFALAQTGMIPDPYGISIRQSYWENLQIYTISLGLIGKLHSA